MKLYLVVGVAVMLLVGRLPAAPGGLAGPVIPGETVAGMNGDAMIESKLVLKPLPTRPNSFTAANYNKIQEAFYVQLFTRAYANSQFRSEKWDEDVRLLIGDYARHASYVVTLGLMRRALQRSDELMAKGCPDPIAGYIRAVLINYFKRPAEEVALLRDVQRKFEEGGYAPIYQYMAARRLRLTCKKAGERNELAALNSATLKWLGKAAGDPLFKQNGFQRCYMSSFFADFDDELPRLDLEQCMREIHAQADVDPWLQAMTAGKWHITKGWLARGEWSASTVTEEGRKEFIAELKLAREELRKAYGLHPEFPEAARLMISVSMTKDGDEDTPRQWFDRAVAAQFDYMPAYNGLVWSMYPRWGGSHQEMYCFGMECMNTQRFDTCVPVQFAVIFRKILKDLKDIRPFCRKPGVYEDMERCVGQVLPKCDVKLSYWKSWMVVVAWAAGRHEDALRYYQELGEKFMPDELSSLQSIDLVDVLGEIHMRQGPSRERYLAAESLLANQSYAEALAIYKELSELEFGKAEPISRLLKNRMAAANAGILSK